LIELFTSSWIAFKEDAWWPIVMGSNPIGPTVEPRLNGDPIDAKNPSTNDFRGFIQPSAENPKGSNPTEYTLNPAVSTGTSPHTKSTVLKMGRTHI
jgi:hypothetical protein